MASALPQPAYRDRLLAANRAVIDRVRSTVSGVSHDALTRRPNDGGWSMAEVLEHLIVSADSYLERLRTLVR